MPLAKPIVPCLDMTEGREVKGIQFVNIRDAGDPPTLATEDDSRGADELVFLDITASSDKRDILVDVVRRTAQQVFIPFSVGGGIRNVKDIRQMLNAGADKISMNTAAVKSPPVVKEGAEIFGSQCIIVAVDAKRVPVSEANYPEDKVVIKTPEGDFWWEVYIYGGRKGTGIDALKWIKQVEELGAGEILLTSMDRDGTKDGYDNFLNKAVTDRIKIPLIASGGCGTLDHIYDAFKLGNASAALAASIFHYKEYTCQDVKDYLKEKNILTRN